MSERRLNRYTCGECGGSIITMDADEGVTPFMLDCRVKHGCGGTMRSHMYRGVVGEPEYVWRKPTPDEYKRASAAMKHHFDLDGLDIFTIQ